MSSLWVSMSLKAPGLIIFSTARITSVPVKPSLTPSSICLQILLYVMSELWSQICRPCILNSLRSWWDRSFKETIFSVSNVAGIWRGSWCGQTHQLPRGVCSLRVVDVRWTWCVCTLIVSCDVPCQLVCIAAREFVQVFFLCSIQVIFVRWTWCDETAVQFPWKNEDPPWTLDCQDAQNGRREPRSTTLEQLWE